MSCRLPTALFLTWAVAAAAAPMSDQSSSPVPVLVELFTSEGCSSCPPADRVLSDLLRTQPVKGVHIIGLSEHVDYWDHQGWKDPFSNAIFTRRQTEHAGQAPAGVYTPQIVVDGRRGVIASDRAGVLREIREAATSAKIPFSLAWSADHQAVEIMLRADVRAARSRVLLAVSEDGLQSSVTRGENEGRSLTHDAVTRRLIEVGRADSSGAFRRNVAVPIDASWSRLRLRIVAFVEAKSGKIVAVEVIPAV